MADLGSRIRDLLGMESAVDRSPRFACVVGAKRARGRDGDEHPVRMARIQNDRVQAQPASPWLPTRTRAVAAQTRKFLPVLPAIRRAEQCSVLNSSVDRVRIGERRFKMPHSLEFPRMRRTVVPLMSAGNAVVHELVANCLPGLPAVV